MLNYELDSTHILELPPTRGINEILLDRALGDRYIVLLDTAFERDSKVVTHAVVLGQSMEFTNRVESILDSASDSLQMIEEFSIEGVYAIST